MKDSQQTLKTTNEIFKLRLFSNRSENSTVIEGDCEVSLRSSSQ